MTTNQEKLEAARQWMERRGIEIKAGEWKGPNVPVPNLAGRLPVLQGYEAGLFGQWRALLRLLA